MNFMMINFRLFSYSSNDEEINLMIWASIRIPLCKMDINKNNNVIPIFQ